MGWLMASGQRRAAILVLVAATALAGRVRVAAEAVNGWLLVMPFATEISDAQLRWLGEGAALVVADGLAALDVNVAEHELRDRAFSSLGVPPARVLSRATRVQVARLAGASAIIEGRVQVADGVLTITARVLDPSAARVWPAVTERGALADFYDVGLAVASRLSVQLDAPPVPATLRLDRPPLDAFQAYVQGLGAVGYSDRVRLLELAIERYPAFDRAKLALADAHAEVGDHERALAAARAVPSSSSRARAARFREARALIDLDQHESAFTLLQALVADEPAAALYNNLGVIQIRRGSTPETGKASFYLTKAAEAAPDDSDILFNLGYAYWLDRDAEGAVYWLREAVRRGPADADTHAVLGAALAAMGAPVESARERELAARLSARYERADWTVKEGDADDPLADLERTIDVLETVGPRTSNPAAAVAAADRQALARFHFERAQRAFDSENDSDAIAELGRVVYLTPYDARAHLLLGRSYLRAGRARDAINAFRLSLWSEESAPAHAYLGEALLAIRDVTGARLEALRALGIDPGDANARRLLERVGETPPR